jgi:hypothetical protein
MAMVAPARESRPAAEPGEVLIKEARRRGRRHLAVGLLVCVSVVGGVATLAASGGGGTGKRGGGSRSSGSDSSVPTQLSAAPSVAAFERLAASGTAGTFAATYVVRGDLVPYPGTRWIVMIGHHAGGPGGGTVGRWSYLLNTSGWRLSAPVTVQWIERGGHYVDCYRHRSTEHWLCGTGTNYGSIGFSYLGVPFIAQQLLSDIRSAVSDASVGVDRDAYHLRTFSMRSPKFGRESCLSSTIVRSATGFGLRVGSLTTWCLTSVGRVVSVRVKGQIQGAFWTYVQLLASSRILSAGLIYPFGAPSKAIPLPAM